MLQDEYRLTLDLVKAECQRQIESAGLPLGIRDALSDRNILFGEHPSALVVLSPVMYGAFGGSNIAETVPAGAAMEFLLAAADVLDDVQDLTAAEQGQPENVLHTHYVNEIELVTALLLLGEQSMISMIGGKLDSSRVINALSIFNTFKMRSFSGQYKDAHGKVGFATDLESSLQITYGKSGSLGRCAAQMGAALQTSRKSDIELAGEYGEHLAVARQLHDDVANLWPGTGKLEDLEQLKNTMPLSFSLTRSLNGASHAQSSLRTLVHLEGFDNSKGREANLNGHIGEAREEVFSGGGIHFTMLRSLIHLVRARTVGRRIEKLAPGEGVLERLTAI